ncbi:MAG: PIN domain-containing protein [Verrucomicrobiales bacterium]|nr:PIN domain-containing protein [Verrucomicrobiales bacterium]
MKGFLLDTNVLIALLWPSHAQHDRAVKWFTRHRRKCWATCPLTEAGFVRIVSNPAFSRDAVTPREAIGVLAANTAAKDHTFWPDEVSFPDAVAFAGVRLVGHQQATDAYLLGLALRRGGVLATMDERITALIEPKSAEHKALEIVA